MEGTPVCRAGDERQRRQNTEGGEKQLQINDRKEREEEADSGATREAVGSQAKRLFLTPSFCGESLEL